jgi:hypothetical protein
MILDSAVGRSKANGLARLRRGAVRAERGLKGVKEAWAQGWGGWWGGWRGAKASRVCGGWWGAKGWLLYSCMHERVW